VLRVVVFAELPVRKNTSGSPGQIIFVRGKHKMEKRAHRK
jgi:hypothetical protein